MKQLKKTFSLFRNKQWLLILLGPKPAKITYYSESSLKVNPNQAKLKITCWATGFPKPVVTWRKDGEVIGNCAGQRDCRYHEQYDGLQIRRPRYPDDNAVFSCEARNKYGIDSKTFTVVVPGGFPVKFICST